MRIKVYTNDAKMVWTNDPAEYNTQEYKWDEEERCWVRTYEFKLSLKGLFSLIQKWK